LGGEPGPKDRFFLNVGDAHDVPYTPECPLAVQPDGFILLGKAPRKQDEAFQEELIRLNNELAVLSRENVRNCGHLTFFSAAVMGITPP